jgi:hypothetical protein
LKDLLLQEVKKEIIDEVIIEAKAMRAEQILEEMTERVFQSHLGKKSLEALNLGEKKDLIEKHLPKMQSLEKMQ